MEELQQEMCRATAEAVKTTFTEFNDKTEARYFSGESRKKNLKSPVCSNSLNFSENVN